MYQGGRVPYYAAEGAMTMVRASVTSLYVKGEGGGRWYGGV